ncbi:MAG TPA: ABC transporter permease [Vicinamibacterales bacterium]|nr:ABC transporter permease [Vicinamibacterales bacterium]
MLEQLAQDVRYGVRTLRNTPMFTAIAALTLALGIGANSAIFSFVDGVLLKPLPYRDADRIMRVLEKPPGGGRNGISALTFLDWQRQNSVFESLAAQTGGSMTLSAISEPMLVRGSRVSASYFDVFQVKPALGRTFAPDEDQPGKEHVVVLSHRLWASQFGSNKDLLGQSLILDGEPYTVIGVMPEASAFDRNFNQMWRPLAFKPAERTRDYHWMGALGRLKPGVTIEQARAQMDAIGARISTDYPDSNKGWGVTIDPYADTIVDAQLRSSLYVLLAAVGMLLLIGCANLANLTLTRGTTREREVTVRAALGAGRGRLVRQFLTENVLLSAIGGGLGLLIGYGMMAGLKLALPPFMLPSDVGVTMDGRVLAFTLALSMITAVLFGLAPTLQVTKPDLAGAMKEGGRGSTSDAGRRRVRGALVVIEVALAFVLLIGSGLLLRSFFAMMNVETGFDSTNVITMRLPTTMDRFSSSEQLNVYLRQIVARIDALPGVRETALTSALPMRGWSDGMPFLVSGRPVVDRANRRAAGFKSISPPYFHTLGMKLLKGRGLTDQDLKGAAPVMVINQTMATRYFEGESPIGQHILVQEIVPGQPALGDEIPWEVVGVVANEKNGGLASGPSAGMYVPLEQSPSTSANLVVRAHVDPATLVRTIGQAIHEINRDQSIADVLTLEQIKDQSAASNKLRTMLLAMFASLAVLLSALGIYGVLSYTVAQRTHEIGIRSALGATRGTLLRLVLGGGMKLALAGLVLGLAGSLALTRVLSSLLFGVSARDPLTIIIAAALLGIVAFLACYVPARRAARLDPLAALRCD